MQSLLAAQQRAFNTASVGRVMRVLFEHAGRQDGQAVGRSPYLQPVHVADATALIGRIVDVRIAAVMTNSLKGHLMSQPLGLEGHHEKALAD